jgi:hypothetical protein
MVPDGTLFIGHSERMDTRLEPIFRPCGITQYLRTALLEADTFSAERLEGSDLRVAKCL